MVNKANKTTTGLWLLEFRKKEKLTQEQMAEKLEVSVSTYAKIEQGKHEISRGFAKKFEKAFGVHSDFLYFGVQPDKSEILARIFESSKQDQIDIFIRLFTYLVSDGNPDIRRLLLDKLEKLEDE